MMGVMAFFASPMKRVWLTILLSAVLAGATNGLAHESRPLYVEITETAAQRYHVQWKVPPSVPRFNHPIVGLPSFCTQQGDRVAEAARDAFVSHRQYHCTQAISGHPVKVTYPVLNPSVSTLFRLSLLSGASHSEILSPEETLWMIPQRPSALVVAQQYSELGMRHIWEGSDHLLFVACLVFLARTRRRIVMAITGFTVAHSITLIFATLQWVRLPIPPVEAAIALSILLLASEINRNEPHSWSLRYPIVVSSTFGLLHGFGFAAALNAIGLPQTEVPLALLFFNLGVEIGQLGFVLVLLASFGLVRFSLTLLRRQALPAATLLGHFRRPVSYLIGSLASFWFFERLAGF